MSSRSRVGAARLTVALIVSAAALALAGVASAATVQTVTVFSGDGQATVTPPGGGTGPAVVVPPNGAYSTIAGTSWISIPGGAGGAPTGNYVYQEALNLPPNAVNPTLSGSYYSDNQGSAVVNGATLTTNNPACTGGVSGERADYGFGGASPTSFTSSLNAGANTLEFDVNNCGGGPNPTGVDYTATASYTLAPIATDDCKNGGWQNLTDRNGRSFKNQGDCVSYVATGGKNQASG